MDLNNKQDNWQKMAPKLAQMEKINPFEVPEGYFETLSARIQSRLAEKEVPKARIIPLWGQYAAAACLTFALGFALYLNLNQENTVTQLSEIPEHEIVAYLQANLDEGDTEVLFSKINEEQPILNKQEVNKEELEEYLNQTL